MQLFPRASYLYVGIIVPACIIIPIIPAIIRYRALSNELKCIAWYLFVAAFTSIINTMLSRNNINNMPVMHFYTMLEFSILALFYKQLLQGISKFISALIPFFILLCIANVIFFQNILTFNTYTKSVEAILIIFFSIAYFKNMLDATGSEIKWAGPLVYINSGLLFYFSGSFILFVIQNILIQNKDLVSIMWSIHATILLLLYILIAVALWKHKK